MNHIVLLGDSIFDNGVYVSGGPSVIDHLRGGLPPGWKGSLLAVDGAVTEDVARQVARLPVDATHLAVSVGGNDALQSVGVILSTHATSFAGAVAELAGIRSEFESDYRRMLAGVLERNLPTVVCTVYDSVPGLEPAAKAGLSLFNDVILREAFRNRLPVLDLRLICSEATDYAKISPIEPSVVGGGKIARTILRAILEPSRLQSPVYC